MTHVPFTGAGPAIVALLGGTVDVIATGPATIVQHVQGGKIRALAHWGEGRLSTLPDVPSLKELGVPITFAQWAGLFAPAETPEPVVAKLRDAARAAGNDPKVREVLLKAGSPVLYQDTPDFQRYVDADAQKMTDVVKRIGKLD
jgi:tripartite-type tricarboxylate transporter receptor subunit TctC